MSSLFEDVMRSNAPIKKTKSEFYDSYKDLNNSKYESPGPEAIHKYQLERLNEFQKNSFKTSKKAESVNNFLLTKGTFNSDTDPGKQVEKSLNEIYDNIIPGIVRSGVLRKENRGSNEILRNQALLAIRSLEKELSTISKLVNKPVSGLYIDKLKNCINACPGGTLDEILGNFWKLQGEILEEVGTDWFNSKIPIDLNVEAISTAKVSAGKGQLITDILVFDMDDINLNNIEVSYTIAGKKKQCTIGELLNIIKNYSGSKQIVLDNSTLDKIMKIATAGIQAKSGKNQLPWNKSSKNTQIKISEMDKGLAPVLALNRLHDLLLINSKNWDAKKNLKIKSSAYRAMANYGVGSLINKILHLSQADNQFVLTPKGYVTYAQRINELFKNDGYYFRIKNVDLTPGMLDVLHPVDIGNQSVDK